MNFCEDAMGLILKYTIGNNVVKDAVFQSKIEALHILDARLSCDLEETDIKNDNIGIEYQNAINAAVIDVLEYLKKQI